MCADIAACSTMASCYAGRQHPCRSCLPLAQHSQAVARQPVVVYFSVEPSFQNYGGGVYMPGGQECTLSQVNHAMVVVGFNM